MLTLHELATRAQRRNDFVVTPVVTASSAYSAGNSVGGLFTLDNTNGVTGPINDANLSSILQSLVMVDKDAQNKAYNLFLFNAAPTTPTDKTAYAPTQADLQKLIGVVSVAAADWVSINSMGYLAGTKYSNLGIVCKPGVSLATAIYATLATGASGTPTFTTTTSLQLRLQFSQGM